MKCITHEFEVYYNYVRRITSVDGVRIDVVTYIKKTDGKITARRGVEEGILSNNRY